MNTTICRSVYIKLKYGNHIFVREVVFSYDKFIIN